MEGKLVIALLLTMCVAHHASAAVNCTAAGRFADTADSTCQSYVLCVLDSTTSTYIGYNYTCPTTSLFNPTTRVCTTNYNCSTTSTNTSSVCTAEGYIADANSTDCSSYIECVDINGTYSSTVLSCPSGTYYDPSTTLCSSSYNCTTTFTCSAEGRFADASDSSCQTYYLCVLDSDGDYTSYEYTCPTSSVFNPNTSMCTTSYTCTS